MRTMGTSNKGISGSAIITVILMISIFFIISVAISSTVILQARSNFEAQMSSLSFYVADAGLRYVTPRVMLSYFRWTDCSHEIIQDTMILGDREYIGKFIVEIYNIEPISDPEHRYTHRNRIASLGQIFRARDSKLVAQRDIFTEILLGSDGGTIRATISKYYEKNR